MSILNNPLVAITAAAIFATVVVLVLAVARNLRTPVRRANFEEALSSINASELDIDTALRSTPREKQTWSSYWEQAVSRTGRVVTNPDGPGRIALTIAGGSAVFGVVVFPGGIPGMLVPIVALGAYRFVLSAEASKRVKTMEKQLPDLLSGLRANLQAGSTVQQSVVAVADDLASPLGDEMRLLKRDLSVNVTLEAALAALARRVPSRPMKFLIASIEIAIRSGADLDPQLASIQDIIAQRARIASALSSAIAGAKPTVILAMIAVPGMFLVSLRSEQNRIFWFSFQGLLFIGLAAALYGAGLYVIRFMIKGVENS